MKKCISVLLILLLLAGCSGTRTIKATPKAAVVRTPSVQKVSVADPKPATGFKVGKFTASYGNSIYYHDYVFEQVQGDLVDYSRLYRMDKLTGKTQMIRQTDKYSYIYQLFTDESGNLYYCLMAYESRGDLNYYLYRYDSSGDERIADQIDRVVRVDKEYIYFYTVGNDQDLFACRLSDKSVLLVSNKDDIVAFEDQNALVDYKEQNATINFTVSNTFTKQTKTVSISNKTVPIHSTDLNYSESCYAYWNENMIIVFVEDFNAGQTVLYRIDMAQSKLLSTKKLPGEILVNPLAYNGKLYFYAHYSDEKVNDQAIYSFDIATGNLKKVYKIKQAGNGDGDIYYEAEVEAGQLFIYSVEEGDGTPVFNYVASIAAL